jgi:5-methylcytosine-specific restriction endonuclease McrA
MTRQLPPQERLAVLSELTGGTCTWCGYDLSKTNARPTRDHLVPKIKGGPTRLENEVAACGSCNGLRGTTAPGQWIEECRRNRGVEPKVDVVASQLRALTEAIAREGGMRKIRDYVARELKRVEQL